VGIFKISYGFKYNMNLYNSQLANISNKYNLRIFFFLFLLLNCINLFGQKSYQNGYIINTDNIKVIGKIIQLDRKNIKFIDATNQSKTINVENLSEYYSGNFKFTIGTIIIDGVQEKIILKELLSGYLSLYTVFSDDGNEYFALKKVDGEYEFLSKNNAISKMRSAVYDCNNQAIFQRLTNQNFKYGSSDLIYIIKKYNHIINPLEETKESKDEFKINFGIESGISMNNMTYFNSSKGAYLEDIVALPTDYINVNGLFIQINPQKTISFEIGANTYNLFSSKSLLHLSTLGKNLIDTLYISEKSISIPILVKYTKQFNSISVFAKAGPKFAIEQRLNGYIKTYYNSTMPILNFSYNKKGIGFNLSGGIEKRIQKILTAKIEYRFSRHTLIEGSTSVGFVNTQQLLFGISLGK
jgi:hypothetical protein